MNYVLSWMTSYQKKSAKFSILFFFFYFSFFFFFFFCFVGLFFFLVCFYVFYVFHCFLVILVIFLIAASGREGFVLCSFCVLQGEWLFFNSVVFRVRDLSSAGQSMTYAFGGVIIVLWAGGRILNVIKNVLFLYISRMYFFTNYL